MTNKAMIGFIASSKRTTTPAFLETLLYTFVAPILPEPVWVISLLVNIFVTILPKGIDPIR